jgi:hypothetical protein
VCVIVIAFASLPALESEILLKDDQLVAAVAALAEAAREAEAAATSEVRADDDTPIVASSDAADSRRALAGTLVALLRLCVYSSL